MPALKIMFVLFFLLIGLAICAFILNTIVTAMPGGMGHDWLASVSKYCMGFIDKSLIAILVFGIIIEIIDGYFNPGMAVAIGGVLEIFMLAFISGVLQPILPSFTMLNISTNLPLLYALVHSSTLTFLLYFMLIIVIVVNLRHQEYQPQYNPIEVENSAFQAYKGPSEQYLRSFRQPPPDQS